MSKVMIPSQAPQSSNLAALETPCLLVDRGILERNIERMHERLRLGGVPLRPHLKTTKCVEIARLMTRGQPGGVTVSTLAEAERFAAAGFRDILYAVAMAPNKLEHAANLRGAGTALTLLIDNVQMARLAGAVATRRGISFPVLIEIDVDGHRSGVLPAPEILVPMAQTIYATPGLELRGLLTHAGSGYDCNSLKGIADVAEQERMIMVEAARTLRAARLPCAEVSVGSTPTALTAASYAGVTEVRAGVFAFNDLMQARLGVCALEDIAISVLCTVIGHHAPQRRLIVDAGWTAVSQESQLLQGTQVHGRICDAQGRLIEDLALTMLNQEHGIVTRPSGRPIESEEFPVGLSLRILPVHACATAAAHDRYHMLTAGTDALEVWPRFGGWTGSD
jgi:D-serine deaminase-like pyridoxal phosphate-dependent protein